MRAKLSLLTVACLLAAVPALNAADEPAKPADKKASAKCAPDKCPADKKARESGEKTVMLTGSNIPQPVTKGGRITDGALPLTVISHDDLAKTGEVNLAQALRKSLPALH